MNSKRKLLIHLFFLVTVQVFTQNSASFQPISKYISKTYNIDYKKPKGFIALDLYEHWRPGEESNIGFVYSPVFQSKDKNCIIMYPSLFPFISAQSQAIGEIKAALGQQNKAGQAQEETTIDFEKYITRYTDKEANQFFNADSAFIVQLPIKKPYKEKYVYCTGVYICKKERPVLLFKYFFTESGKLHEQDFLRLLHKKIWYRDGEWIYDERKQSENYFKYVYKKQI